MDLEKVLSIHQETRETSFILDQQYHIWKLSVFLIWKVQIMIQLLNNNRSQLVVRKCQGLHSDPYDKLEKFSVHTGMSFLPALVCVLFSSSRLLDLKKILLGPAEWHIG